MLANAESGAYGKHRVLMELPYEFVLAALAAPDPFDRGTPTHASAADNNDVHCVASRASVTRTAIAGSRGHLLCRQAYHLNLLRQTTTLKSVANRRAGCHSCSPPTTSRTPRRRIRVHVTSPRPGGPRR